MIDSFSQIVLNLLIDSLWIGAFSCLFLFLLLKVIHTKHAILRYNVSLIVYFGSFIILLVLATAQHSIYNLWLKPKVLVFSDYIWHFSTEFNLIEKTQLFILNNSHYILWVWTIGIFVFFIRFLMQFSSFSKIQETTVKDSSINQIKNNLKNSLGIKREVTLKETNNTSHAFTIGCFKPIILLPVQAITGVSIEELEIILCHELVHIKRNDYLTNIIQLIIEGLFFFNPFMLLMSSTIKKEREASCDAIVISHGYSKTLYAKALQNSYELHYKLALNFGRENVFSRIKSLTLFRSNKQNNKNISHVLLSGLALCIMMITFGFGVTTKNNMSVKTITKDIDVYPHFTIKSNGDTIIFHPDEHRAWHIYKNGKQAFYRDGVLRNDELEANFEYKEVDKGDVIEIIYVDKLLNREHSASRRSKKVLDSKPFIKELYEDLNIQRKTYNINDLLGKLHITPFGDMYFNDKRISKGLQDKYQNKYRKEVFEYYGYHFSDKDKEEEMLSFLKNMIDELQKDNLVSEHFNLVQVVFTPEKNERLLLNGKLLSKKHTKKYMIYLNKFSSGTLYEGHSFYLK